LAQTTEPDRQVQGRLRGRIHRRVGDRLAVDAERLREITGWLIKQGYKPDGRWAAQAGVDHKAWRRFKLA